MKTNLKLTESTKGSQSVKRLAIILSARLGYKVFRTLRTMPRKQQLSYGQGTDKLTQYQWFQAQGLSSLEFTANPVEAVKWLQEGLTIFGRKLLSSSCGRGIVVMQSEADHQFCPVYTKYKKKKREFRVHIYKEQVVAIVEKKRRAGWEGQRDCKIRNLANGYVFCQNPVNLPEGVSALAIAAGKVVASNFKGVDIGYNEKNNELFIIEVNSAPGMEGSNLEAYANAICN